MENIELRKVTIKDLLELQKIGRQIFYETFIDGNSEDNLIKYLEDGFSTSKLTSELNDPNAVFYFAIAGKVIGYLKLNFGLAQTDLKDLHGMEIERIYVLQEYHGKKVGQFLLDKAMQMGEEKKVSYIWLGVWEENPRAIQFYKKNGFKEFGTHIFKLGEEEQTDVLMKFSMV